jgi:hypothetical protein
VLEKLKRVLGYYDSQKREIKSKDWKTNVILCTNSSCREWYMSNTLQIIPHHDVVQWSLEFQIGRRKLNEKCLEQSLGRTWWKLSLSYRKTQTLIVWTGPKNEYGYYYFLYSNYLLLMWMRVFISRQKISMCRMRARLIDEHINITFQYKSISENLFLPAKYNFSIICDVSLSSHSLRTWVLKPQKSL